ncbi:hypothetical protein [Candidatus Laterigemmans baculatus]|uniref:hypothetical protein n=1 Tax=Candidatus Laterigemmans baculatus TaxID=2770505 RepID=UPI0013DCF464|nr:hypothetical protein [Candidatus Laterigemmans baculatus]
MTSLKESGRGAEYENVKPESAAGREGALRRGSDGVGNEPAEKHGMAETVQESAVSHDKPMERKAPQAPFALVGLAYLAVLAVIGLLIGIVLFALS